MPTHRIHSEKEAFYFVTFTCYRWLPLFEQIKLHDYLPKWVESLSDKKIDTCGYVMMPNHLHLLVYVHEDCEGLNKVIGDGKRFMAYEIISRLKKLNDRSLLKQLSEGVQKNESSKGKKHQVFRLSFDAKQLKGQEEINSVLNYIHHNPVSGKWNLAEDFTKYPYSSARFYELEEEGSVNIVDYRVLTSESSPTPNQAHE